MLMKLQLNPMLEDLGYGFNLSKGSISRMFHTWIDVMYARLKFLIVWPTRDVVRHNMSQVFKDLYTKCRCITDCLKVFIERPFSLKARALTYSNYKHHNTVKILIAISPCGTILYLSSCWGGHVSDKYLTQSCGFLNLLEYGDTVLADCGFNISENLALFGATLAIPSLTTGKSQLSQQEVECSQRLAKIRFHVERVIGQMKNKFTVLQSIIPISLVNRTMEHVGLTSFALLTAPNFEAVMRPTRCWNHSRDWDCNLVCSSRYLDSLCCTSMTR